MVSTSPKSNFAAIEVLPGETPTQALGAVLRLSKAQGHLCSGLELYDTFKINKTAFVRFRSDLDILTLKISIIQSGRGVITPQEGTVRFEVSLADGSKGNYSATAMHSTCRATEYRKFRGTRDKFWERQF